MGRNNMISLKGEKGNQGDPGPRGFSPVEAIANDDAMAELVEADRDSATGRAIATVAAGIRQSGMEIREDYTNAVPGFPTYTATGQTVSLWPPAAYAGGIRTPRVVGGFLTYDDTAVYGGYCTSQLDGPARNLGVIFAFTPWTEFGGSFNFSMMEEDIATSDPNIPRSPMHFTITPTNWALDVFPTLGPSSGRITVASGAFETPLTADGATLHVAEVTLDAVNTTAYILLPDGTTVTASHEAMAIPASFVWVEMYRDAGTAAAVQTKPLVKAWWSDSRGYEAFATARAMEAAAPKPSHGQAYPTTDGSLALSGTTQHPAGASATVMVPSSGKLLVSLTAFMNITSTGGTVFFYALDGGAGNPTLDVRVAGTEPNHSGWTTVEMVLDGLTPGELKTILFGASLYGGGAAALKVRDDGSLNRYSASVTVTAL